MLRRRLWTILRPYSSSATDQMYENMYSTEMKKGGNKESIEAEYLRAEQLLLLSLHPEATTSIPTYPNRDKPNFHWAEPGWLVRLHVPQSDFLCDQILPRTHGGKSQCIDGAVIPGRQLAYSLAPRHLKNLMNPLSDLSKRRLVSIIYFYLYNNRNKVVLKF